MRSKKKGASRVGVRRAIQRTSRAGAAAVTTPLIISSLYVGAVILGATLLVGGSLCDSTRKLGSLWRKGVGV